MIMPSTTSQASLTPQYVEMDVDAPSVQDKYDLIKEMRQRQLLQPGQLEPVTVTFSPSHDNDEQKNDVEEANFIVNSNRIANHHLAESQFDIRRVGRYAYRQGVSSKLTASLQNLLHDTGMDETFRVLLTQNALEPNESLCIVANDNDSDRGNRSEWNIQRPRSHWSNNMHWIAPSDENAQRMYMDALERGEFDKMLTEIAREFGGMMDDMDVDDGDETKRRRHDWSVHHAFFIGVSHAEQSYTHCDFEDTDGKGFTMLIPLRLVGDHDDDDENTRVTRNSSAKPELGFQNDDREWYAWYKYQYGEAALVGDGTWHVTADCEYRDRRRGDYRICANIYICRDDHPIHATTNTKGVYS